MELKKKKVIKLILTIILIIIAVFLFSFWSVRTFAKNKEIVESNGVSEVAKPIFVVDGAENIKIDGIEDTVYNFSVRNYEGNQISEVGLRYFVEIVNFSGANLEFILVKDGQTVKLEKNKSELMNLKNAEKQEDCYQLQIKYGDNSNAVSDIHGNIQIKVDAVQAE